MELSAYSPYMHSGINKEQALEVACWHIIQDIIDDVIPQLCVAKQGREVFEFKGIKFSVEEETHLLDTRYKVTTLVRF